MAKAIRLCAEVNGFFNNWKTKELFQKDRIQINYTCDAKGETLSLASLNHEIQISIPVDSLLRDIERLKRGEQLQCKNQ